MSRRRRQNPGARFSDCENKHRYTSERQARKHVRRATGARVRVYHCPYCHGYHVTAHRAERHAENPKRRWRREDPDQ